MRFFLWLSVILISANTLYMQAGIFKISARDGNQANIRDVEFKKIPSFTNKTLFTRGSLAAGGNLLSSTFLREAEFKNIPLLDEKSPDGKALSAKNGNFLSSTSLINEAKKKLSQYFYMLQIYERKKSNSELTSGEERVIDASIINTKDFQTGCRLAAYQMCPDANFKGGRDHKLSYGSVCCQLNGLQCRGHWLTSKHYENCKNDGTMRFIARESLLEKGVYSIYFESSCVVQVMIENNPWLHRRLLDWIKIETEEALRSPTATRIPL